MHHHEYIKFKTRGEVDIVNITDQVAKVVRNSGIREGTVTVFAPGATAAISTIEYEPGLLEDFPDALERLFPKGLVYKHHLRWHDGNGHSHCRAAMLGPDITVPVIEGNLTLGTWQQIVFIELDNRPRDRKVVVQVIGE
ncbi:MAG: secondary thiamine-phosphate synthase enzyme YjbQ [Thermoplasmata archaeon]|nr:secondary thiamine-phosphate synthase enzyme YjbQ [Thermoplasmata archaeon]